MLLGLTFCQGDETISGYSAPNITWALESLDGKTFAEEASIGFPEEGKIEGNAPCNTFFGSQTAPYPWFKAEGIGATRMACASMAQETAFFAALGNMTIAEVSGDTLILTNDDGGEMVFRAN